LNFDICTYILFFCSRFRDHSGDLDTFELSNAVAELWGHAPTMAQLSAMVHEVGAHETHKLSFKQFSDIFTQDWPTSADEGSGPVLSGNEAKVGDMFEEEFGEGSLGFGVLLDELNCRIVVSTTNPKLGGKVQVGDGVLAVNGVPLGRAFHPGILQVRLKPLRRPLVLTFVRLGEAAVEGLFDKPAEVEPAEASVTPENGTGLLSPGLETPSHANLGEIIQPKEEISVVQSQPQLLERSESLDKACMQKHAVEFKIDSTSSSVSELLSANVGQHSPEVISSTFDKFDLYV